MKPVWSWTNGTVYWWGGWPWKWRCSLVRQSRYGAFGELLIGPVSFVWGTSAREDAPSDSDVLGVEFVDCVIHDNEREDAP